MSNSRIITDEIMEPAFISTITGKACKTQQKKLLKFQKLSVSPNTHTQGNLSQLGISTLYKKNIWEKCEHFLSQILNLNLNERWTFSFHILLEAGFSGTVKRRCLFCCGLHCVMAANYRGFSFRGGAIKWFHCPPCRQQLLLLLLWTSTWR